MFDKGEAGTIAWRRRSVTTPAALQNRHMPLSKSHMHPMDPHDDLVGWFSLTSRRGNTETHDATRVPKDLLRDSLRPPGLIARTGDGEPPHPIDHLVGDTAAR